MIFLTVNSEIMSFPLGCAFSLLKIRVNEKKNALEALTSLITFSKPRFHFLFLTGKCENGENGSIF